MMQHSTPNDSRHADWGKNVGSAVGTYWRSFESKPVLARAGMDTGARQENAINQQTRATIRFLRILTRTRGAELIASCPRMSRRPVDIR